MRVECITCGEVTIGQVNAVLGDQIETPGSKILGHPRGIRADLKHKQNLFETGFMILQLACVNVRRYEGMGMGKRYVYWLTPEGKPYKGADGKHAPDELLANIGRLATVNSKGEISWHTFFFHSLHLAIKSVVAVIDPNGDVLNAGDTWSIVWKAIHIVIKRQGGGKAVKARDVIDASDRLAASRFRQRASRYTLVSSLSISDFPRKRVRICDCECSPLKGRFGRYKLPDILQFRLSDFPFRQHIDETQYQVFRINSHGRTAHEAVERALSALNVLRAIWTILATYGSWSMSFSSPRRSPIGVIHLGPIHTLHNPGGSSVDDKYWYQSDYTKEQRLFKPRYGWTEIERGRKHAVRLMRSLPYRREFESILVRYVTALDNLNLDVAILQMWGILEILTDTTGGNYDDTIRRAAFVYPDRPVVKQLLQVLRLRRNQFVHSALSGEDQDQVAHMIKSFIEPHLLHLVRNDFSVQNLQEYGEFLAQPTDRRVRQQRARHSRAAKRVLGA